MKSITCGQAYQEPTKRPSRNRLIPKSGMKTMQITNQTYSFREIFVSLFPAMEG